MPRNTTCDPANIGHHLPKWNTSQHNRQPFVASVRKKFQSQSCEFTPWIVLNKSVEYTVVVDFLTGIRNKSVFRCRNVRRLTGVTNNAASRRLNLTGLLSLFKGGQYKNNGVNWSTPSVADHL